MIKTIATALAATAILAAPSFADYREGNVGGYRTEVIEGEGRYSDDFLVVQGPNGQELIRINCANGTFYAYGRNTQAFAEYVRGQWCG